MTKMNNKLVIKENFDEADLSDDIDDEVFVRDGKKNMVKIDKQKCDEQPLMPARKKLRQRPNSASPDVRSRQPCNIYNCLLPVYFAIAAIISIAFLMLLYIFLVDKVPVLVNRFSWWTPTTNASAFNATTRAPCNVFKLNRVWSRRIPRLLSDSQIRLVDVDRDGIEDLIIGTQTKPSKDVPPSERSCDRGYNLEPSQCPGGVIARNGKTGGPLWALPLSKEVLAVHCDFDITKDGVPDCVVTGKSGLFIAVSGTDGSIIWDQSGLAIDLYNVLIINDVNLDGYKDILASKFTRYAEFNHRSSILVMSGKGDEILYEFQIPVFEAILHAPQIILNDMDGGELIIFVTGGPERPGGLYAISMGDMLRDDSLPKRQKHLDSELYMKTLFHFDTGVLAAPIMADLNSDGISDVIFLAENTTFAVDGSTFRPIWNTSLYDYAPKKYSILATRSVTPAYFDDDDVPDLLITFSVGAGYPAYFYSVIIILNGKNGQLLTEAPIIRPGVADTVGDVSLSFDGVGNDAFLFWVSSCKSQVASDMPYEFMPPVERADSIDMCELRFNSTSQLELYALNQHVEPPGSLLKSERWHENRNFDVRDDFDEQQVVLPNIVSSQDRPQTYDQDRMDDGQYADGSENNPWKEPKSGYRNNGPSGVLMNDIPDQQANVDYGPSSDILMNNDRNEKEYNLPRARDSRLRIKRNNVNALNSKDSSADKMLPRVSASGVLAPSLDSTSSVDVILMHYEVQADNNACIVVDKQRRCLSNRNRQSFRENIYGEKAPMSNLFISRYRVTCDCLHLGPEEQAPKNKCSKILPYEEQSYPAYMGLYGYSTFKSRFRLS